MQVGLVSVFYTYICLCTHFWCQYSVSLQSEEEVQDQYQRRQGQAVSVTGHGRHLESCLHTASSHFSLPIPLNVTPGFSTDIGQSTFRLSSLSIIWHFHIIIYVLKFGSGIRRLYTQSMSVCLDQMAEVDLEVDVYPVAIHINSQNRTKFHKYGPKLVISLKVV